MNLIVYFYFLICGFNYLKIVKFVYIIQNCMCWTPILPPNILFTIFTYFLVLCLTEIILYILYTRVMIEWLWCRSIDFHVWNANRHDFIIINGYWIKIIIIIVMFLLLLVREFDGTCVRDNIIIFLSCL